MNPFLVYPTWLSDAWGMGLSAIDIWEIHGYVISIDYITEAYDAFDADYDNYVKPVPQFNTY